MRNLAIGFNINILLLYKHWKVVFCNTYDFKLQHKNKFAVNTTLTVNKRKTENRWNI